MSKWDDFDNEDEFDNRAEFDDNPEHLDNRDEFDQRHLRSNQREGSGFGTKFLYIILGIVGVLMLLCCGGGIFVYRNFQAPEPTTDPAKIATIVESMLDLDLPARFEPENAMTMNLIVAEMEMANYKARDGKSTLLLMRMEIPQGEQDLDEMTQALQTQSTGTENLENFTSESETYEVDGQKITVVYTHGTQSQAPGIPADQIGKEVYLVQSSLVSDGSMIMLTITGPEEEFDQEEIETMIRTIRLKK